MSFPLSCSLCPLPLMFLSPLLRLCQYMDWQKCDCKSELCAHCPIFRPSAFGFLSDLRISGFGFSSPPPLIPRQHFLEQLVQAREHGAWILKQAGGDTGVVKHLLRHAG